MFAKTIVLNIKKFFSLIKQKATIISDFPGSFVINNKRNPIYDVIKGLGIIAIVLGHCHPNMDVVRFVYGFHLAIFFFVAGLQFNDSKYAKEPFLLVQNRIKSMWPSYFCYMTFFTLTINFFCKIHILSGGTVNSLNLILKKLIANFFISGSETLGGAMWFVPMLLSGTIIFATIVYFSTVFINRYRLVSIILLSLCCGFVGIVSCDNGYAYSNSTHVSTLLIPLLLVGYLISLFKININRILKLPIAIITLILFVYFTTIKDYLVNLAVGQIVSVYLFYPIIICGIYSISYIAKVLSSIKFLSIIFSFIGKYSFDIMALHFLIIKTIDLIFGILTNASPTHYSYFPRAYPSLWPVYLIASVTLAPLVRIFAKKIYSTIKKYFERTFAKKEIV